MENQATVDSSNLTTASDDAIQGSEAAQVATAGDTNNQATDVEINSEGDYWSALERLKSPDNTEQSVIQKAEVEGDNKQAQTTDDTESEADVTEKSSESEAEGSTETDDEDGGEEFVKRFYARHRPEVEQYALTLLTRNRDLSMEEALAKAKAHYGLDAKKVETQDVAEEARPTVDSVKAKLADLRAQRKEAKANLDFDKEAEVQEQIEDLLLNELPEAQKSEESKVTQKQREFDVKWDESQAKAVDLYDFVKSVDSPESLRMAEIDQLMKQNGDPLFYDPNKPLILAQMVAREFSIAPKTKRANVVPPKPKPQPKPVQPASGNARTNTPPVSNIQKELAQVIDSVQDEESFMAALDTLKKAGAL